MKIGIGYDVHKLTQNRKLILGGVEIPFEKGLLGHSDADVLIHAIMDSLLGAACLGDIGRHFPDTNDKYKNISSCILLKNVHNIIRQFNFSISNIDCIIIAQAPKVAPYIENMRQNIAQVLEIDLDSINIKATTTEHLGFEGKGEGIAAQAICLLKKSKNS